MVTSDGSIRLDLREIKLLIIASSPAGRRHHAAAAGAGLDPDLYKDVADIRANGQTIVYCVHDKIGHLGIFVSGGVAKKEHAEFATNIDFIDRLLPGLYEAVLTPSDAKENRDGLMVGDYVVRFEHRSLDAIPGTGTNDIEDERCFAAVARLSEINLGLYRTFLQLWVRAAVTPERATGKRRLEPVAAPVRVDLGPEPAFPFAELRTPAERVRELLAGGGRQSVPGGRGDVVAPDRGLAGCLSRPA